MIIPILIVALLLRLINLNQSLWLDEATQAILSQDSIKNILFNHSADFHPPLSYILMHFWIQVNTSEIWLRLFSVIFAILTIWITYKISKINKNTQVADNWAVLEDFFKKSTAEIDASLKRVRHKYPHMFSN